MSVGMKPDRYPLINWIRGNKKASAEDNRKDVEQIKEHLKEKCKEKSKRKVGKKRRHWST